VQDTRVNTFHYLVVRVAIVVTFVITMTRINNVNWVSVLPIKHYAKVIVPMTTLPIVHLYLFIVDPGSVSMQCINTSCLYTVIVNYYIADPYSLLSQSTSDMSDFNTSSCLTATCSPYGIMGTFFPSLFSICDFAWSCAPYLYPITPLKKRGVDEVAAATTTTTTRNSYQQRFKKFGKDGRPNPPPYSLVAPNPSSLQMINISDPNSIPPVAFPYLSLHDQGVVNRMLFNLKIDAYTHYCASIENQSLQLYTLSL
jgi:hypothetical protein